MTMLINKKNTFLIFILFALLSCGQSSEEKIEDAIERAKNYLSSKNCSKALEVLNEVGVQVNNSSYMQTYASGHACNAGFSEPVFFATDLPKLGTVSATNFLGALTKFSTSIMTSPTSASFISLQTAIDTLLFAGGITKSSHANRLAKFTASETSNMGVQALYMIMAQMGQYLNYYGNGLNGSKGAGTGVNSCLVKYTDAAAIAGIGLGVTGSCTDNVADNVGHVEMEAPATAAERKTRMCQYAVLFNNFIDIIGNISFSGSETGELGDIYDIFKDVCTTALGGGSTLCIAKTQSVCEDETNANLEQYFALIIEVGFTS